MPRCTKHKRFDIKPGTFYRCADFTKTQEWEPKNKIKQNQYYAIAISGDLAKMAEIIGPDQLAHAAADSAGSPYISVAKGPLCLFDTTDPTVREIVKNQPMSELVIEPRNSRGQPYVFEMGGRGVFAAETECLVLLPPQKSLLDYRSGGFLTGGFLNTLR
jgi:hypothetical protein